MALDYAILDLDGVLVTDSNAVYGLMRYGSPEAMLGSLDFVFDDNALAKHKRVVSIVITLFFLTLLPSYLKARGGAVATAIVVVILYLTVKLTFYMAGVLWDMATERSAFSEAVLFKSLPRSEC